MRRRSSLANNEPTSDPPALSCFAISSEGTVLEVPLGYNGCKLQETLGKVAVSYPPPFLGSSQEHSVSAAHEPEVLIPRLQSLHPTGPPSHLQPHICSLAVSTGSRLSGDMTYMFYVA